MINWDTIVHIASIITASLIVGGIATLVFWAVITGLWGKGKR